MFNMIERVWGSLVGAWRYDYSSEIRSATMHAPARPLAQPVEEQDNGVNITASFDEVAGVIIVGIKTGNLSRPAEWLSSKGVEVIWVANLSDAMLFALQGEIYSHLIVDVDQQGGAETCFDALLRFRKEVCTMPVILFSNEFAVDNFELNRIWLCDVSLTGRASVASLELAMLMSPYNNNIWQTRCKDTIQSERAPSVAAE